MLEYYTKERSNFDKITLSISAAASIVWGARALDAHVDAVKADATAEVLLNDLGNSTGEEAVLALESLSSEFAAQADYHERDRNDSLIISGIFGSAALATAMLNRRDVAVETQTPTADPTEL